MRGWEGRAGPPVTYPHLSPGGAQPGPPPRRKRRLPGARRLRRVRTEGGWGPEPGGLSPILSRSVPSPRSGSDPVLPPATVGRERRAQLPRRSPLAPADSLCFSQLFPQLIHTCIYLSPPSPCSLQNRARSSTKPNSKAPRPGTRLRGAAPSSAGRGTDGRCVPQLRAASPLPRPPAARPRADQEPLT